MTILALNCGSSSLKFQAFAVEGQKVAARLARGTIERLGDGASLDFEAEGREPLRAPEAIRDHAAGVRRVIDWLASAVAPLRAVGHRIVHGGPRFVAATLVDDEVLAGIEATATLAPLHNGPGLAGIRAARAHLPSTPMVAAFDTAFHATLPEHARAYALPHEVAERHDIRRYGFHGLSYQAVVARYATIAATPVERTRLVVLHLGNGASAAAVAGGRSVDTSMGLTPLEGLVMGTRSGDLDPAIVTQLARAERVDAATVEHWLNERSGLLGLSGRSADVRDLLAAESTDRRARLALEVFCYRARKYVGAYLAALGGADAVVFTGGIGERAPAIRARICAGLEWLGVALDPAANDAARGVERRIGRAGARVAAWVIPTDEERVIAEETLRCLAVSMEATR
jgi:acetate kinase